jgi:hypothetical protein
MTPPWLLLDTTVTPVVHETWTDALSNVEVLAGSS